jgi:signal transduction histidine kinase
LLGNAFKFTLQGEIRIIVRYDGLMCISIKDSGTGIRKEDQSTLFKAFGKGDNIENKKYNKNGVGLGLLISNMLAQQLSESG